MVCGVFVFVVCVFSSVFGVFRACFCLHVWTCWVWLWLGFGWGVLVVGCPWVCCVLIFPVSLLTRYGRGVVGGQYPADRLVHRRSFLLSCAFSAMRCPANRLVHRRSFLLSCAFSAMRCPANRLVHRRSFLLSCAFSARQYPANRPTFHLLTHSPYGRPGARGT